MSKITKNKNNK